MVKVFQSSEVSQWQSCSRPTNLNLSNIQVQRDIMTNTVAENIEKEKIALRLHIVIISVPSLVISAIR